jgi:flagellar protein FliL
MARLIPLIGAAVVALLIGGGAGWYFGNVSAPKTVIVAEEKPHYVEYAVTDRIVNLADPGGRRYLKVSMVLQVAVTKSAGAGGHASGGSSIQLIGWTGDDDATAATGGGSEAPKPAELPNKAQVHDAITTVLTSKRSDEITTTDGRERLREELKNKINTVMPKDQQVAKVFFTDFIIQ